MATVTARGSGTNNASNTSFNISPSGNFTAGSFGVLGVTADNGSTGGTTNDFSATLTDSLGNVWTLRQAPIYDNGAASAGIQGAWYTSDCAAGPPTTGTTIPISTGAAATAKGWSLYEVVRSAAGYTMEYVTGGVGTGATVANPTLVSASVAIGQISFFAYHGENVAAVTGDADSTNGTWDTLVSVTIGTTTSGIRHATQSKKQTTAASTQSWTATVTSQDCITSYIIVKEVGNGSFTANAIVRKTVSSSFTADAVVKKTVSPSFTGDAVLKKTLSGSFTAAALISRTVAGTLTANAVMRATGTGSFTANAVIAKLVWSDEFNRTTTPPAIGGPWYKLNDGGLLPYADGSSAVNPGTGATLRDYEFYGVPPITRGILRVTFKTPTSFATDTTNRTWFSIINAGFTTKMDVGKRTEFGVGTERLWIGSSLADIYLAAGAADTWYVAELTFSHVGTNSATGYREMTRIWERDNPANRIEVATLNWGTSFGAWSLALSGQGRVASMYIDKIEVFSDQTAWTATSALTADAVIKKTQTGSFTADAVLKKTQSGSFTADAIIRKTQSEYVLVPASDTSGGPIGLSGDGGTSERQAQSMLFAARTTISRLLLAMTSAGSPTDDVVVSVTSVLDGAPLTSSSIAASSIPTSFPTVSWVSFPLSVELAATTTYFIEIARSGTRDTSNRGYVFRTGADAYADGITWTRGSGSWVSAPPQDLAFALYAPFAFTADAVISAGAATPTGSFTADTVIKRTQAASFTADAIKRVTTTGSFTADAVIARTETGSFTADTVIKKTQSSSFAADAIIRRTASSTLTADSVIRVTIASSLTASAVVKRTATATFLADAVLRSTISGSFTANAVIKTTVSGSLTGDAIKRRTEAGSFTADAIVRKTQAASITANAVIFKTQLASFTANAVIMPTFTINAIVKRVVASSFTANAVVMPIFTANAIKRRTESASFLASAFVQGVGVFAISIDAVIRRTNAQGFTLDSAIRRTETRTFSTEAIVKSTATATLSLSAILKRTASASFTLDAIQLKTASAQVTANAVIRTPRTAGFSLDAVLLSPQTRTLSVDARIQASGAASFTANAVVLRGSSSSWTVDACLRETKTGSFSAAAFIRATGSGSWTLDALFKRNEQRQFVIEAVLQKPVQGQLTLGAVLRSTHVATLQVEAEIVPAAVVVSVTADAVIRRSNSGSFVAAAYLYAPPTEFDPLTAANTAESITASNGAEMIVAANTADMIEGL